MKREIHPAVLIAIVLLLVICIGGIYAYTSRPSSGSPGHNGNSIVQSRKGPMPQQTSIPKYNGQ